MYLAQYWYCTCTVRVPVGFSTGFAVGDVTCWLEVLLHSRLMSSVTPLSFAACRLLFGSLLFEEWCRGRRGPEALLIIVDGFLLPFTKRIARSSYTTSGQP